MKLSKKGSLILVSALSLSMVLAGCAGKATNPAAGSTPTMSTTPVTASAPAASSTPTQSASAGGEKIVMKLGHTLSQENHYQLTAQEFARIVKEKTNGKIEIQLFPKSQLGGEVQMTQALKTGTQELEISSEGPIANSVKEWGVFDLPFLFDSIDQGNQVLQGPVGQKYLDMLEKQNLVGLAWISVAERDVFTSKKQVRTINDMKSLKVRVLQSPGYVNVYRALGANPVPLAYNELYLAMQQGLVDGADISADYMVQDKFAEISKNFSLTHVHYMPVALVLSKSIWDKLTPDLQKVMKDAAKEAAKFDIQSYKKQYADAMVEMKKKGVEVIEVDTKPWIQATESVRNDLIKQIPNGDALYKEIIAAKK